MIIMNTFMSWYSPHRVILHRRLSLINLSTICYVTIIFLSVILLLGHRFSVVNPDVK